MYKNFCLGVVLAIVLIPSAFANLFYVGGGLGRQFGQVTLSDPNASIGDEDGGISGNSVAAYIGYVVPYSTHINFSLELNAGWDNSDGRIIDTSSDSVDVEAKNSYGFSVIPAYALGNDTHAYARLGLNRMKFDVKDSGNTGIVTDRETGIDWGFGLEMVFPQLHDATTLGVEYRQVHYDDVSITASGGNSAGSYELKPTVATTMLYINYYFGM